MPVNRIVISIRDIHQPHLLAGSNEPDIQAHPDPGKAAHTTILSLARREVNSGRSLELPSHEEIEGPL